MSVPSNLVFVVVDPSGAQLQLDTRGPRGLSAAEQLLGPGATAADLAAHFDGAVDAAAAAALPALLDDAIDAALAVRFPPKTFEWALVPALAL